MAFAVFVNPTCLICYVNRQRRGKPDDHSLAGVEGRLDLFAAPALAVIFQSKESQGQRIAESYTAVTEISFRAGKKIPGRSVMHINGVFIGENKFDSSKSVPGAGILTKLETRHP